MNAMIKKAGLGLALAATALATAAPAEAQRYYGRHRGGGNGGAAVVAGIAGLAIGAAIASNRNDRFRDDFYYNRGFPRGYDDVYFRDHGFYPNDGYYAYNYRPRFNRCRVVRQWDPYWQQPVRIRICR